jgi:hypothetical protein
MAGLHNTLRRLVLDGTPVATGLHAIGDSVCTTNPTFGRGLALSGAADLADTLGQHGGDPTAQALAMDRLVTEHVLPFYQAAIDAARLAVMRHTIFGERAPAPPAADGRVSYPQLRAAASYDPVAFRAFWTINGMICPPEEVYTDPLVVACTRAALSRHGSGPPVAQPTRQQLLAALAGWVGGFLMDSAPWQRMKSGQPVGQGLRADTDRFGWRNLADWRQRPELDLDAVGSAGPSPGARPASRSSGSTWPGSGGVAVEYQLVPHQLEPVLGPTSRCVASGNLYFGTGLVMLRPTNTQSASCSPTVSRSCKGMAGIFLG